MLRRPFLGWTEVAISGEVLGPASYVDDVPSLVLDALINWFSAAENGCYVGFCLEFDAEGYSFAVFEFDGGLYAVDDREPGPLSIRELDGHGLMLRDRLRAMAAEAIHDIREDIDAWKYWNPVADEGELAEEYKTEYLKKCGLLEQLIDLNVQRETCISPKNTCENTCFTGNKDEDKEETLDGLHRKVLVSYGLYDDKVLFITDAPKTEIEDWCRLMLREAEDGECSGFDWLKERGYYVRILFDTEEEIGREDIDVIGYDEAYDLCVYAKEVYAEGEAGE